MTQLPSTPDAPGLALVVGFRMAGQAAAGAWRARGGAVIAVDDAPSEAISQTANDRGVELIAAPDATTLDRLVDQADLVFLTPGIPIGHPVHAAAARHDKPVMSEIEFAWLLAADRPGVPAIVAITGTNGKTTVTTLVTDALVRSGRHAEAAGNIGVPLVDVLTAEPAPDVVVAEVSSFQLELTARFHPDVSCWLNLAPDHLDWHPTHEHYRAAKAKIWANQTDGDVAVINADDPQVVASAAAIPAGVQVVTFSTAGPADWWEDGTMLRGPEGPLIDRAELPRALPHDRANALAAAATASAAGAAPEGIRAALAQDRPLPHRVELVAEAHDVRWYDDSKATTPAAVTAAVAGFDSVVLIAGGHNKGLDLSVLAATAPPVRVVVAIGEAAGEVAAAFDGVVPVQVAGSMAAAVATAAEVSRGGDAVILSPGCASFDWYTSYGARGDDFARLVREMVAKGRPG
jgi:UDP-N-acetylmuramoylalanine--D-glutamate ligase